MRFCVWTKEAVPWCGLPLLRLSSPGVWRCMTRIYRKEFPVRRPLKSTTRLRYYNVQILCNIFLIDDHNFQKKFMIWKLIKEYLSFSDECEKKGCSQFCANTPTGAKCLCKEGQELDTDGKSCKGKSGLVTRETRKMINRMFVIIILITSRLGKNLWSACL